MTFDMQEGDTRGEASLDSSEHDLRGAGHEKPDPEESVTPCRTPLRINGDEVLSRLTAHGGRASLVHIARDIAAAREGCPPKSVDTRQTRSIYTSLHAGTLQALSRRGLIEYDDSDGTVRLTIDGHEKCHPGTTS